MAEERSGVMAWLGQGQLTVDPRGLRWLDVPELAVSRVFEGVTLGPTARVGVVVPGISPGVLLHA